jgi:GMP synthase-like glutamine amidotransferase
MKLLFIVNDPDTELFREWGGLVGMLRAAVDLIRTKQPQLFGALGGDFTGASLEIDAIDLYKHADRESAQRALPSVDLVAESYAAVVLSGSEHMVTDNHPFAVAEASWLLALVAANKTPVLGICFGHQLLGQALGGQVAVHPPGGEYGSLLVRFNEACEHDPVMAPVAAAFADRGGGVVMQVVHTQAVTRLPPAAVLLGSSAREPSHVVRFAPRVWGVQGHPEYRAKYLRQSLEGYEPARDAPYQAEDDSEDVSAAILCSFLAFAKRNRAAA